jgi:RNA polymerase sigma-32 factor
MIQTHELHVEQQDWQAHQNTQLKEALQELDERSQDIIAKRWLAEKKTTLHELAEQYQVSAERIRQLEHNAIKKLKAAVIAA